jgi:hypothetical protein
MPWGGGRRGRARADEHVKHCFQSAKSRSVSANDLAPCGDVRGQAGCVGSDPDVCMVSEGPEAGLLCELLPVLNHLHKVIQPQALREARLPDAKSGLSLPPT